MVDENGEQSVNTTRTATQGPPYPNSTAPSLESAVSELNERIQSGIVVALETLPPQERRAARILLSSGQIRRGDTSSGLTELRPRFF